MRIKELNVKMGLAPELCPRPRTMLIRLCPTPRPNPILTPKPNPYLTPKLNPNLIPNLIPKLGLTDALL